MKVNWRNILSLTATENNYFDATANKIEFTGCKLSTHICSDYLPEINKRFRESDQFYRNKDFTRSIDALEKAYYKAGELKETSCRQCSMFFQATVIQSLESIHSELSSMGKGLFATRRYDSCLLKADEFLQRVRNTNEVTTSFAPVERNATLQPAYL